MKCPKCQSNVVDGTKFCFHCGCNLEEELEEMKAANEQPKELEIMKVESEPTKEVITEEDIKFFRNHLRDIYSDLHFIKTWLEICIIAGLSSICLGLVYGYNIISRF